MQGVTSESSTPSATLIAQKMACMPRHAPDPTATLSRRRVSELRWTSDSEGAELKVEEPMRLVCSATCCISRTSDIPELCKMRGGVRCAARGCLLWTYDASDAGNSRKGSHKIAQRLRTACGSVAL